MKDEAEIKAWLVRTLAAKLRIPEDQLDVNRPIDGYGLDSMEVLTITAELEDRLDMRIAPTVVWDHRTVAALAAHLAAKAPTPRVEDMSDEAVAQMLAGMKGR